MKREHVSCQISFWVVEISFFELVKLVFGLINLIFGFNFISSESNLNHLKSNLRLLSALLIFSTKSVVSLSHYYLSLYISIATSLTIEDHTKRSEDMKIVFHTT